jgi:hypothetical protein
MLCFSDLFSLPRCIWLIAIAVRDDMPMRDADAVKREGDSQFSVLFDSRIHGMRAEAHKEKEELFYFQYISFFNCLKLRKK